MKIRGIMNGAVLQRDGSNVCSVKLFCDEMPEYVSVSDPWSNPVTEQCDGGFMLRGIRTGGPYEVNIGGIVFDNIYVGDVWLLTGQSNMQGIGRMNDIGFNTNGQLRALYLDNRWDIANHPLHIMGHSYYKVHTEVLGSVPGPVKLQGAGPGVSFAEKMYDITHAPQGLIICGHGGTNLEYQWNPQKLCEGGDKSLYAAAYERYLDSGSNCAGVFWYQGCSDAKADMADKYRDNMINLVAAFRHDFKRELPFVEVQICRCSWEENDNTESNEAWSVIRETQRTLHGSIAEFDTVHTSALRLSDCIHLNAASQNIVGRDAAEAMSCLIRGKMYGCLPGIKLADMQVIPDDCDSSMCTIVLTYDNVHGQLSGGIRPMGFDTSCSRRHWDYCGVCDTYCDGNSVYLRCTFDVDTIKKRYLWYGTGRQNCCNIVDSEGRSLPGFGPIPIACGAVD